MPTGRLRFDGVLFVTYSLLVSGLGGGKAAAAKKVTKHQQQQQQL